MNKFTMGLVWHNCLKYPPSESFNGNLYVTNGTDVYKGIYEKGMGWELNIPWSHSTRYISLEALKDFWWADIEQTVQGESRFKE